MINQSLEANGSPAIDYDSFSKQYDSEDVTGPLHNIIGTNNSFDNNGISFNYGTQQPEIKPTDTNSEVSKMAKHELNRKK